MTTPERTPEEVEKDQHLANLKLAEQALRDAQDAIELGRRRLQNAIRRYEERSRASQ